MKVEARPIAYRLLAILLRAALIVALAGAGWLVYRHSPNTGPSISPNSSGQTTLEIVLLPAPGMETAPRDIAVEISPLDIVAVRHEFYVEPRPGQRFDDFVKERMKGRSSIQTRLDKDGRASLNIPPGNWWIHAVLSHDEDLEWRLQVTVTGGTQTVELTPQNAYTRSKSF